MRTLTAWRAERRRTTDAAAWVLAELADRLSQPLPRDEPQPQMRGPVDPWHDPCGRPPLPRGGPDA